MVRMHSYRHGGGSCRSQLLSLSYSYRIVVGSTLSVSDSCVDRLILHPSFRWCVARRSYLPHVYVAVTVCIVTFLLLIRMRVSEEERRSTRREMDVDGIVVTSPSEGAKCVMPRM